MPIVEQQHLHCTSDWLNLGEEQLPEQRCVHVTGQLDKVHLALLHHLPVNLGHVFQVTHQINKLGIGLHGAAQAAVQGQQQAAVEAPVQALHKAGLTQP